MLRKLHSLLIERHPRIYLGSDLSVPELPGEGPLEVAISRGLCQYLRVDLSSLRRDDRASALRLHITRVSPFPEFDWFVSWAQGVAEAWFWDRRLVEQAIAGAGIRSVRFVPATRLVAPVAPAELVQYPDGCEVRLWTESGELRASDWWPRSPDEQELGIFRRAQGLPAQLEFTRVAAWTDFQAMAADLEIDLARVRADLAPLAWSSAIALVVMMLTWNATGIAKSLWQQWDFERQIQALESTSQDQLEYRKAAYAAQDLVEMVNALQPFPTQLQLTAEFARLMAGQEIRLELWKYDGNHLWIQLTGPEFDLLALTREFESSPLFGKAEVRRGAKPRELVVELDLVHEPS